MQYAHGATQLHWLLRSWSLCKARLSTEVVYMCARTASTTKQRIMKGVLIPEFNSWSADELNCSWLEGCTASRVPPPPRPPVWWLVKWLGADNVWQPEGETYIIQKNNLSLRFTCLAMLWWKMSIPWQLATFATSYVRAEKFSNRLCPKSLTLPYPKILRRSKNIMND